MDPVSLYVHVPFCSSRCGYCDFNTYTASELGNDVSRDTFGSVLAQEVALAARVLGQREVRTVFVGGGTPTLLGSSGLVGVLDTIREAFVLAEDAEVTTEANPDSVTPDMLEHLVSGGYTRISLGMQSSSVDVLRTLERTHTPGRSVEAARQARAAGFEHVNLDLIYGTPGETDDDLRRSVADALSADVDHVSAYSLIVEDGTPLARRVSRGEIPAPDDDVAAERYVLIDTMLSDAGLTWYEVSNWALPGGECRHNLAYWHNEDWWGIGPGAHSHVDGTRWWNVKNPLTYAHRLAAGESPEDGREVLTDAQRRTEAVMLGIRLAEGMTTDALNAAQLDLLVDEGLLARTGSHTAVLTDRGRLLADLVVRRLLE